MTRGKLRATSTMAAPSTTDVQPPAPPTAQSQEGPPPFLRLKATSAEIRALIEAHATIIDSHIMTGDAGAGIYDALCEINALLEILLKKARVWPAD